jgi:subtilisin family serine protease
MTLSQTKKTPLLVFLLLGILSLSFGHPPGQEGRLRKKANVSKRREIRTLDHRFRLRRQVPLYAEGQILVKFRPETNSQLVEASLAAYGTTKLKRIAQLNVYLVKIPRSTSVEEMAYVLSRNPDVEYAEPNFAVRLAVTPNDPLFEYQYALRNTGQTIPILGSPHGTANADIRATSGWEETTGSAETIIAIVDTGVDLLHPDLKNKILSAGRDFVNDDFDATDDNGHGTFVAGIAAAETENNEGIAGVAWNCEILPVKVIAADGTGFYDELIEGIIWAADNGAQVINLSLGGDVDADVLREAVKYAHDKGVVVAAAAGNEGAAVLYPAAYDTYCLAVAASDYNDTRPSWSNFGSQVDVAAPGLDILSAVPTWYWEPGELPYAFSGGTSAASPHVAGLAGLIKGLKPWLTVDDVMNVIRYSADDINSSEDPGKDDYVGYGRINMEKALVPLRVGK